MAGREQKMPPPWKNLELHIFFVEVLFMHPCACDFLQNHVVVPLLEV